MQHGSDLCHCRLLEKNKKMDKRLRKIARYCKILQDIARSVLQLSRPIQNGVVKDWEGMEAGPEMT